MWRIIITIAISLLLGSCKTTEKKAKRYAYNNKDKLAEWCADCFPVKESEVIKGDTIVDTLYSEVLDTLYKIDVDCPDGTTIIADCPPSKTFYKTITKYSTDTIRVRDRAKEEVLSNNIDERYKEINKLKERLKYAYYAIGGLLLLLLISRFR